MRARILAPVVCALLIAQTAPSYAGDGRIEINQTRMDAAGGPPFVIDQPGSYVLTGDLVVGANDVAAVQVDAPNVTLDLNGFSLTGPVSCPGEPPTCSPGGPDGIQGAFPSTTIRNGSVTGMKIGVSLVGSGARVEDLNVSHCTQGISAAGVGGNLVARNIIRDSNIGGFLAAGLARDNTLRNVNFGLSFDSDGGYAFNVVVDAPSASAGFAGGVALAHNLCNGQRCGSLGRRFYLSKTLADGSQALTACAGGFHMASLWEVFDPSNLRYDTQLGTTSGDSGQGPPEGDISSLRGWMRTGAAFLQFGGGAIGKHSCSFWTTQAGNVQGTDAALSPSWTAAGTNMSPWTAQNTICSTQLRVWCVED